MQCSLDGARLAWLGWYHRDQSLYRMGRLVVEVPPCLSGASFLLDVLRQRALALYLRGAGHIWLGGWSCLDIVVHTSAPMENAVTQNGQDRGAIRVLHA